MADYAHELTDRELTALEKKIAREYERARDKVQERADKFFDTFREDAEKLYKAIADAPDATTKLAAEKAYKDFVWRKTVAAKNITDLRDKLAADLTAINQRSAALIGERMNGIFSLNHNFAAYTLEHDLGLNLQFTLYDEFTVARLLKENPKLLPKPKIDVALDKKWNAQKITSEITQGILTGESIPKIASRLQNVTDMNRNSAIRNARTAITSAENAGRIESYHYAESIGIKLQKEWLATLDDRTRDEHRALDGQRVDIDEPFVIDGEEIMYPGDPSAEGYLVYGCRCTMVSAVEGVKDLDPVYRRDNISGELVQDMNYNDWLSARSQESFEAAERAAISQASKTKDIVSNLWIEPRSLVSAMDKVESTSRAIRTSYTKKELEQLSRDKIVAAARQTAINNAASKGLTEAEAVRRFNLLVNSNTTPQLIQYVNKYGKK
jgi:SPP1 gp7 family putative phage head morphogenesis protein